MDEALAFLDDFAQKEYQARMASPEDASTLRTMKYGEPTNRSVFVEPSAAISISTR